MVKTIEHMMTKGPTFIRNIATYLLKTYEKTVNS